MLLAQNWERFKVMNPNLSQYKIDEVEKMLHCRDPKYGFLTYKCAKCDTTKTIPLACKIRICTQCGKKYADLWADELVDRLYVVPHHHMVFTMPEELNCLVKILCSYILVLRVLYRCNIL